MASGQEAAPTGADAVDDAIARLRAAAGSAGGSGLPGPGEPGSVDADVLRTALATLPDPEQRLLWDHHVLGRAPEVIADSLGLHARSVARQLRRAEERLALALSAAHARGVPQRLCAETRGALHDYVHHRLGGGRRQALEGHLFGCAGCLRAFIDVRESGWALRDAAPVLLAPLAASGLSVPVVVGALGDPAGHVAAGWFAGLGAGLAAAWEGLVSGVRRFFSRPAGLAAGGVVAAVTVAAVAMSLAPGSAPSTPEAAGAPSASAAEVGSSSPSEAGAADAPGATPTPTASDAGPGVVEPDAAPDEDGTSDGVELDAGDVGAREQVAADDEPDSVDEGERDDERESDDAGADRGESTPTSAPTSDPAPGVEPEPGGTSSPRPTATPGDPEPSPRPTAPVDPVPTAEPAPEPEPAPAPVTAALTLTVGRFGWFQVVPTGDAEIVGVTGGHRTEVSQDRRGRWWVRSVGNRERDVTVEVTGAAGTEPGARLSWFGVDR
jgi:hypothetical protein